MAEIEKQREKEDTDYYVVFVVTGGIVDYGYFDLLTQEEAIARAHQHHDDYREDHLMSYPEDSEDEVFEEETARRRTAINRLQSVDMNTDDDLVIMRCRRPLTR